MSDPGLVDAAAAGRRGPRAAALAAVAVGSVCLYFLVDVPLARFMQEHGGEMPAAVESFLDGASHYGQVFSVIFILLAMFLLDPRRRREAVLMAIAVVAAAVTAQLAKNVTGRARPKEFLAAAQMWHFLRGFGHARFCSMPSAHAATAFALSAALSRNYPRGRTLFFAAAALCAVSRLVDLQHFLSDLVIGSTLGTWVGYAVYRRRWSAKAADLLTRAIPLLRPPETPGGERPAQGEGPAAR